VTMQIGSRARRRPTVRREVHFCRVDHCLAQVAPRYLMCWPHWRRVPRELQVAVEAAFVPGQERTKRFTRAYVEAAEVALAHVAALDAALGPPRKVVGWR